MLLGLVNALSVFQHLINKIFSDLLDICMIVYLDNILIYSDNIIDYRKHVKEVLRRLQKNNLYILLAKYIFYQDKIKFLEFVLDSDGLKMDKMKVQTICDQSILCRVKDIQSFLRFINFYKQFINRYSKLIFLFIQLT